MQFKTYPLILISNYLVLVLIKAIHVSTKSYRHLAANNLTKLTKSAAINYTADIFNPTTAWFVPLYI